MKFSGEVGFYFGTVEVKAGVWEPVIKERHYTGSIENNTRRFQQASNQQNDNLEITNQISILSDLYARNNYDSIIYVLWNGVKWKVTYIDIDYPKIVLNLGGKYNGKE